ncbi:MAG: NADH-quinone oxidoreductase subunit A [Acidobacteriota bacterium]
MLSNYIPLAVMALIAAGLATVLISLSHLFGPRRWNKKKLAPYECGVTPIGNARERFPVKFFAVAILFILFDVEAAFFYPAALIFRDLAGEGGAYALIALGLFLGYLLLGYAYLLMRKALEQEE